MLIIYSIEMDVKNINLQIKKHKNTFFSLLQKHVKTYTKTLN